MTEKWRDSYYKWRASRGDRGDGAVPIDEAYYAGWVAKLANGKLEAEESTKAAAATNVCPCGNVGLPGHPKNVWCETGWRLQGGQRNDALRSTTARDIVDDYRAGKLPYVDEVAPYKESPALAGMLQETTEQWKREFSARVDALERRVQHGLELHERKLGLAEERVDGLTKRVQHGLESIMGARRPGKSIISKLYGADLDDRRDRGPCPCGMSQADLRHPPGWCASILQQSAAGKIVP